MFLEQDSEENTPRFRCLRLPSSISSDSELECLDLFAMSALQVTKKRMN
jgi:hypothetical protein